MVLMNLEDVARVKSVIQAFLRVECESRDRVSTQSKDYLGNWFWEGIIESRKARGN